MTKADIVEQIYEQVGFSKKESAELVEKVFETIKDTLARGEKVKIFKLRRRKHYRKTLGHRQNFTEIQINGIVG